jgi:hypothetical protein
VETLRRLLCPAPALHSGLPGHLAGRLKAIFSNLRATQPNGQTRADGPDWTNVSWETTKTVIPDAATAWHNYKVMMYRKKNRDGTWSNNVACEYYIDGVKVGTHTGNNFFNQTLNIIINLQMEAPAVHPVLRGYLLLCKKYCCKERCVSLIVSACRMVSDRQVFCSAAGKTFLWSIDVILFFGFFFQDS